MNEDDLNSFCSEIVRINKRKMNETDCQQSKTIYVLHPWLSEFIYFAVFYALCAFLAALILTVAVVFVNTRHYRIHDDLTVGNLDGFIRRREETRRPANNRASILGE